MRRGVLACGVAFALAACGDGGSSPSPAPTPAPSPAPTPPPTPTPSPPPGPTALQRTPVATFDNPWAMTFLPDGRLLVTEKPGRLRIVTQTGTVSLAVAGVPAVVYAGQGGLLDVVLHPGFASNGLVYLSYSEAGGGGTGLTVARGRLVTDGSGGRLENVSVIWRQDPKASGSGHFGARLAFSPSGHLFVTAGERQQGTPAQDKAQTLGKIVRLNADGTIPADNPFVNEAGTKREIWSWGHRNPYGLAFDSAGRLWEHEMGPEGGDEFNLIERGLNYGWPNASNGSNYGGGDIPDHRPGDGYAAPAASWTPVIAPAGLIIYSGPAFSAWRGDAIIGGLIQGGLVRVRMTGTSAAEVERISLDRRIREVEQGPDGAVWVLEDYEGGRLIKLTPG